MERILVSACLLGVNCKYDGGNNYNDKLIDYLKDKNFIPICPEIMGGLTTPREPSELKEDQVLSNTGKDVTENFVKGAYETLLLAKKFNCTKAILKAKSPSCGHGIIYDGTFTGTKVEGNGITAELLEKNGIEVLTEEDFK